MLTEKDTDLSLLCLDRSGALLRRQPLASPRRWMPSSCISSAIATSSSTTLP